MAFYIIKLYNFIVVYTYQLSGNGTLVILIIILCGQKYYFDHYLKNKNAYDIDIDIEANNEEVQVDRESIISSANDQ